MASKQQGTVTKIYQLKVVGFPDVDKTLDALLKKFQLVKTAKQEMEKQAANSGSSKEVDELNKKIEEQIKMEKQLTLEIKKQSELRKRIKLAEEIKKTGALSTLQKVAEDNSIKEAREANKQLRSERDLLNTSTVEGTAKIKELNDQIDRNNQLIKENVDNLSKQKINIGNYEGAAKIVVEALSKLEEKITSLKTKQSGLQDLTKVGGFMTSKQREELEGTNQELEAATKQFTALQKITSQPTFLNLAGQMGTARGQIGFLTGSLAELEIQGQKDTDQYRKLQAELARLTDVMQDTRAEIKAMSSDTRSFDLVASGINTLTSAMQTAAGVSVLFGDSQEEVQRKIQFLLAVENVANGIRSIANDLTTRGTAANKAYAFIQGLVAKSLDATAAAGTRAKAALGLLGIAVTVIGAIAIAYTLLRRRTDEAATAQKVLNEILKESGTEYTAAVQSVNELRLNIQLAKDGFISKKEVVKQYNETIGKTTGEVKNLDEAEQGLQKNADAYIKFTLAKAAAQLALAKAANEALLVAQQDQQFSQDLDLATKATKKATGKLTFSATDAGEAADEGTEAANRVLAERKRVQDASNKRIKNFEDIANQFQTQAAEIAKKFNFNFFGAEGTDKKDDPVKNQLNTIDALRDEQLAKENQRVLEIKKVRQLTLDEEVQYLNNVEKINLDALNSKIKYLDELKKKDADELKTLAEFRRDRVETEIDTLDAIQKARDDSFKQREGKLKEQLDRDIEDAKLFAQAVQEDPTKSATDKAQAQLDLNNRLLELQRNYNAEVAILEKELNQTSKTNAEEGAAAIKKIEADKLKARKELSLAELQKLISKGEQEVRTEQINFDKVRKTILDNQKLTALQRQKQLDQLEQAEKRTILSKELTNLENQLQFKKVLLDLSLLSDEEYQKAYQAVIEKSVELSAAISDSDDKAKEKLKKRFTDLKSFIQKGLRDLFKVDEGSETDAVLGDVIAQSYDLAFSAMTSFYDAERDRINENLQLQLERLDMEKQQVIARAQSQAEIESIEKEFDLKRRKAQQAAGEQLKKTKKSEAKIALASELANIWSSVWQLGPVAGAIAGVVLSGLALARYSIRIGEINREKFEKGGAPTKHGGQAKGRSHARGGIPFNYEAEDKELFIINKKSAEDSKVRTIRGTNRQIASMLNELGGGISFAKGAKQTKFASGGFIGDVLQPPVLASSAATIIQKSISKEDLQEVMSGVTEEFKNVADEQSKRIDRLEVVQDTRTVTNAQKKQVRQSSIGTL